MHRTSPKTECGRLRAGQLKAVTYAYPPRHEENAEEEEDKKSLPPQFSSRCLVAYPSSAFQVVPISARHVEILVLFMCNTCPSQLYLLIFTSSTMLFIPVGFVTSMLVMCSCQRMLIILLRHLPSNPLSLLSIFLLVLQVSDAYRKTDRILDL